MSTSAAITLSSDTRTTTERESELLPAKLALGEQAPEMLDGRLGGRSYLVGDSYSIADVSNFAYTHVAEEAGYGLTTYPSGVRLA